MNPIDCYLEDLGRRLLVRRRYQAEILTEIRGHLDALVVERGRPFASAQEIGVAFGDPRTLARRISASVPWQQARLPWMLVAVGPLALLGSMALMMLVGIISTFTMRPSSGPSPWWTVSLLLACTWLCYLSGPIASMAYAARVGARAFHTWLVIMGWAFVLCSITVGQFVAHADQAAALVQVPSAIAWDGLYLLTSVICAWVATGASLLRARLALLLLAVLAIPILHLTSYLPLPPVNAESLSFPLAIIALLLALPLLAPRSRSWAIRA